METFETKYDLLDAAYKDKNIKKSAMALLQYLISKSDRMKCFPSVDTIAKAMNVCRRTVQYNMRKLEAAGYIIRKDRWYNHQQLSNSYEFNFGIKDEEKLINRRYSAQEKDEINEFLIKVPAADSQELYKSKEVLKIYNMNLSKYEKLLMVYFIHRANKSAVLYDDLKTYADSIGVCRATLVRLLHSLRDKGLILIKTKQLEHVELYVIKLTGIAYTNKNEESIENRQNKVADHHQDMNNHCANVIKRSKLKNQFRGLPRQIIGYIRRKSGIILKEIRKYLSWNLKERKRFLSKFMNLVGSIFHLE